MQCPAGYRRNTASGAPCIAIPPRSIPAGTELGKQLGEPRECVGNACDPATGNKFLAEADYVGSGPFPLRFVRYYNALDYDNSTQVPAVPNRLGPSWHSSYERRVDSFTDTTTASWGAVRADHGRRVLFKIISGTWTADRDVALSATQIRIGTLNAFRVVNELDETETYDPQGKLISLSNRAGLTQTFTYDSQGRLAAARDAFQRTLTFGYDASNRLTTLTGPAGEVYRYAYDSFGRLSQVTYPDGRAKSYVYNEGVNTSGQNRPFELTGIVDESGVRFATYKYDATGRMLGSEHAGGAGRVSLVYTSDAVTEVTDARATKRTFGFQNSVGVKRLTSLTQPCAECTGRTSTKARSYDANGNLASVTDFKGTRTEFGYDVARHLETSRTQGAGTTAERNVAIEWHPTYRLPVRIAEPGRDTVMSYDGNGNMVARSVADTASGGTRTWAYTFDGNGQLTVIDGPRADVSDSTTYTYYPVDDADVRRRGMLATLTDALGHVTEITDYDAHGKPLRVVDPNGLQTTLTYDVRQRLVSRDVGGELTAYEYDPAGQLTKTTLPDGSYLSFSYDAAHRLTAVSDSLGNRIAYTLDATGNRVKEDALDPSGALAQTRAREYDALNRLARVIGASDPAAQITRRQYDAAGNLTQITDPLGRVTAITYDPLDRLIGVTDPAAGLTRLARSPLDQVTSVTDARGLVTTYQRDGLDNLSSQTSPDTGTVTNTHDAAGNLVSSTDARGVVATYTYDALDRLTGAQFTPPAGSSLARITHTYEYDLGANGIGRLTRIRDSTGSTSFAYDAHGRLIEDTRVIAGASYTTAYRYDQAGRLSGMTYPSGRRVEYSLDSLGRISAITTAWNNSTRIVLAAVTYRPLGEVQSFVFGNGQPYTRTFDLDGRVSGYSLGERTQVLGRDAAGRISALSDAANPANATQMGYDGLDRLTSFITPSTSQNFSYDPVGNRLTQTVGANTYSYAYPVASNRLTSASGPAPLAYTYDAAGNTTATGKHVLIYDARGRLSQVINPANGALLASYQINALGQRVQKTVRTGPARVFLYDSAGHLIGEAGAAGQPLWDHIWLGDLPVAWVSVDQDEDGIADEADNCINVANPNQRDIDGDGIGEVCDGDVNRDGRVDDADALVIQQCVVRLRPCEAKYDVDGDGRASATDALRVAYRKGLPPGPSGLRGEAADAQMFYVYPDHLGSPRVVTDTHNQVRWRWDNSDPFGANVASEDPDGDFLKLAYPLRFAGQYFDRDTGRHYNYHRDYDPGTGRYIQSDPAGLPGGINLYAYAGGDPISAKDPTGLNNPGTAGAYHSNAILEILGGGSSGASDPGLPATSDIPSAARWMERYSSNPDAVPLAVVGDGSGGATAPQSCVKPPEPGGARRYLPSGPKF